MRAGWWAEGRAVCGGSVDRAVGDIPKGSCSCSFSELVWSAVEAACACCLDAVVFAVTLLGLGCMSDSLPGKLLDGWSDEYCGDPTPDAGVAWRNAPGSDVSAESETADMECAVWSDCCADSGAKRL